MEGGVEAEKYRHEAPGILHALCKYPILRAQKLMHVKPNICKKAESICSEHDHWICIKSCILFFQANGYPYSTPPSF